MLVTYTNWQWHFEHLLWCESGEPALVMSNKAVKMSNNCSSVVNYRTEKKIIEPYKLLNACCIMQTFAVDLVSFNELIHSYQCYSFWILITKRDKPLKHQVVCQFYFYILPLSLAYSGNESWAIFSSPPGPLLFTHEIWIT